MTLNELKQKADTKLAQFWSLLQTKQTTYYNKNSKYFQLLVSPETHVEDGIDTNFSVRHPSDESFVVDVDFAWSDKVPFQIRVDEWVGNGEAGYSATVLVKLLDGRIFTRSRTHDNQDTGWYEYLTELA